MIRRNYIFIILGAFALTVSSMVRANTLDPPCRYLIITADSLKESFKDFAYSKAFKGYNVRIKSIEAINSEYGQYTDSIERVKRYLKDYYQEHGDEKTFVLLGGCVDIIPTRDWCSAKFTNEKGEIQQASKRISTDLYFACMSGSLDWNDNGNWEYAEVYEEDLMWGQTIKFPSDNASVIPNFIISRLPVRNKADVSNYMGKLSAYERGEVGIDGFYDKMLFAGTKAYYYKNGKSDSNHIGDSIVDNIIHVADPDVSVSSLYDTYTSFPGKSFVNDDLNETLYGSGNGYNVMNIFTHGSQSGWIMQDSLEIYESDDCSTQSGGGAAVIVSPSCYTGDFQDQNSLALSFILNPDNHTVAYWGNTNAGWVNPRDSVHGVSYKFVEAFFYNLMNNEDVSIGSLIDTIQNEIYFSGSEYSQERFVWMSSALLGDAEMKVYKHTPSRFEPFDILISGGYALMDPYYTDAKYSLVFYRDPESHEPLDYSDITPYFDYVETDPDFLYEVPFDIGICQDGYAPYRSDKDGYREVKIQGTVLTDESLLASRYIIGRDVSADSGKGGNSIAAGGSVNLKLRESLTINDCFECPVGATLNIEPIK